MSSRITELKGYCLHSLINSAVYIISKFQISQKLNVQGKLLLRFIKKCVFFIILSPPDHWSNINPHRHDCAGIGFHMNSQSKLYPWLSVCMNTSWGDSFSYWLNINKWWVKWEATNLWGEKLHLGTILTINWLIIDLMRCGQPLQFCKMVWEKTWTSLMTRKCFRVFSFEPKAIFHVLPFDPFRLPLDASSLGNNFLKTELPWKFIVVLWLSFFLRVMRVSLRGSFFFSLT